MYFRVRLYIVTSLLGVVKGVAQQKKQKKKATTAISDGG